MILHSIVDSILFEFDYYSSTVDKFASSAEYCGLAARYKQTKIFQIEFIFGEILFRIVHFGQLYYYIIASNALETYTIQYHFAQVKSLSSNLG